MVLGERRVDDAPVALVEQRLFGQGRADAHDDAAPKLTGRRLRVQDPATVERAEPARDAHFARVLVDAHLAEVHAVRVHGVLHHLERRAALGFRLDGRATETF